MPRALVFSSYYRAILSPASYSPFFFLSNSSAVAVKNTSPLLLRAVSTESWTTPMMKPTATACMATSLLIPKNEQAIGISSSEPPATPEAPQAPKVAITPNKRAEANVTSTPTVCATAKAKTVIVTAAPSMLIVAPSGILTE